MLFKTTQEIKKYLPANAAFEFEQIRQFVLQAEITNIIPVIGKTTYDAINQAYSNNSLNDNQKKLLDKIRYPLANYAYLQYIPFAQVAISASGIHIDVNEQKKTAFEWQIRQLQQSLSDAADNGIEQLYLFLEDNKTTYTDWASSSERSVLKECFINTASEFNYFYNISSSRRLFRAIRDIMIFEEERIKSVICQPLFDAIKAEILSGTISPANKALLAYIKPAIAFFTVATALLRLDVKITPEGIQAYSTSDRMTQGVRTPAELQRIANLSHHLTASADEKVQQLINYLHQNIGTYPLYSASPCYNPAKDAPANDTNTPFFIV